MDPVRVSLDMFPADVTLADGTLLRSARIFVADDRVLVYTRVGGTPKLTYEADVVSMVSSPRNAAVVTEDGTVQAHARQGCGCGNPLKRFNPWPDQRRVRVRQ